MSSGLPSKGSRDAPLLAVRVFPSPEADLQAPVRSGVGVVRTDRLCRTIAVKRNEIATRVLAVPNIPKQAKGTRREILRESNNMIGCPVLSNGFEGRSR